jgi:hypothetical protein
MDPAKYNQNVTKSKEGLAVEGKKKVQFAPPLPSASS